MQTLTEKFKKEHNISEVIEGISDSGQKIVYIVKDASGQKFAMKVFRNCTKRDLQEITILERFNSLPGISRIAKIEEDAGNPIIFEEYIDGSDLQDLLKFYAGDLVKVANLMKDIATTLQPIWLGRIVHRDLKPKNIRISSDGKPVIIDFGIARDLCAESITQTGAAQPMTWDFASPEQYAGDKSAISYRTDFFALGLIAYRLFYQNHPFGQSRDEIGLKFQKKDNTILLENNKLKKFFEGTLAIDPSGRVRTVDSFINLLGI